MKKNNFKYFTEPALHASIGIAFALATLILEKTIHSTEKSNDTIRLIIYFIIVFTLFVVIGIINIIKGSQDLKKEESIQNNLLLEIQKIKERNPVSVEYTGNTGIVNNKPVDNAYKISLDEVKKAKNRILIVSDYSPAREDLVPTVERQNYYKAIEAKLHEISKEITRNEPFVYMRFMQREPNKFRLIAESGGKIDKYDLVKGDEQAFGHCKRILKAFAGKGNVDIHLYVTVNIPSIPSILLIDDHKLLFTIPERQMHVSKLETAGVLNFTDNTRGGSAIIEPFARIINSLRQDEGNDDDPPEVIKIKSISDFNEPEWNNWWNK